MTEIVSREVSILLHYKDSEPIGATVFNGTTKMYALHEMSRKETLEFFEANQAQA